MTTNKKFPILRRRVTHYGRLTKGVQEGKWVETRVGTDGDWVVTGRGNGMRPDDL